MISNRLAFAALGIACVAAAAGGGYMATRDNAASRSSTATETAATVTPADRPLPAPEPATETVAHNQAAPAPSTPASRTVAPAPRRASAKARPKYPVAPVRITRFPFREKSESISDVGFFTSRFGAENPQRDRFGMPWTAPFRTGRSCRPDDYCFRAESPA